MTFGLLRGICEGFFPENRPQTKPQCDRPPQAPCNPGGYGYRPPAGGYGCPPPPAGGYGGYGPCPPPAGGYGGYGPCPPPAGMDPNRKAFHIKGNEIGNNEGDTVGISDFGNGHHGGGGYNGQNPNGNAYFGVESNQIKNNRGKTVGVTGFGNY